MKQITFNSSLRSLILMAVMLTASVVSYADYVEVDGLRYRLTGDSTASFYGAKYSENYSFPSPDVAIPASITYEGKNYSVTEIDNEAFYKRDDVKIVTIPETVTTIGAGAFCGCGIEKISVPNSVTELGDYVLGRCTNLKSAVLGDGIDRIPQETFSNCVNLRSVTFPSKLTSIGLRAFKDCSSLIIPDGELPQTLKTIREDAFINCSSLTTLTLPESVTFIGYRAFKGCSSLKTFIVPRNAKTLGEEMLAGCTSLVSLTVLPKVTRVYLLNLADEYYESDHSLPKSFCAGCTSLTKVEVLGDIYGTGENAFDSCVSLEEVTLPSTLLAISARTFLGCSNLKHLNYSPNELKYIGPCAFENCVSLTALPLGDATTAIRYNAFEGCSNLTEVVIPDNVTSIGSEAFRDCDNLVKVTLGKGLVSVNDNMFAGCNKLDTVVLNSKKLENVYYSNKNQAIVTSWFGDVKIKNLIIGDSVTCIPAYFMKDQTLLEQIDCGASVDRFHVHAFDGCIKLKTVNHTRPIAVGQYALAKTKIEKFKFENTGEDGTTAVANYAFYNCKALKSIEFSNDANYNKIGESAFEGCKALTEVVFPMAIETFDKNCFKYCMNLTSITMQKNFKQLGVGSFEECPIKSIYIYKVDVPTDPLGSTNSGDAFDEEVFSNATLYVPLNCKEKYQANSYWGKFQKIVEMDWDSISDIKADSTTGTTVIYTLDGRRVMNADAKSLPAGIYIINGKKTLVR